MPGASSWTLSRMSVTASPRTIRELAVARHRDKQPDTGRNRSKKKGKARQYSVPGKLDSRFPREMDCRVCGRG